MDEVDANVSERPEVPKLGSIPLPLEVSEGSGRSYIWTK